MSLPKIELTKLGAASWQKTLVAAGFDVRLDDDEVIQCEILGGICEPIGHPTVHSEYPYRISISNTAVQLRCLEVKQKVNDPASTNSELQQLRVSLVFMLNNLQEKENIAQVRQVLIASGLVVE